MECESGLFCIWLYSRIFSPFHCFLGIKAILVVSMFLDRCWFSTWYYPSSHGTWLYWCRHRVGSVGRTHSPSSPRLSEVRTFTVQLFPLNSNSWQMAWMVSYNDNTDVMQYWVHIWCVQETFQQNFYAEINSVVEIPEWLSFTIYRLHVVTSMLSNCLFVRPSACVFPSVCVRMSVF